MNTVKQTIKQNVLVIHSSLLDEGSISSQLSERLIDRLGEGAVELDITVRDFRRQAIPHLDGEWLNALVTPDSDRNDEQQRKVDYSNNLVAELQAADTLIITLPMYNFSVPSMLKAWVDHIARAGVTFKYTDQGPEGLLRDKKVYLVATMGGIHDTGDTDFLRPYMKFIMSFIGLTDVEIITADGLNMGPEQRETSISSATARIDQLIEKSNATESKTREAA